MFLDAQICRHIALKFRKTERKFCCTTFCTVVQAGSYCTLVQDVERNVLCVMHDADFLSSELLSGPLQLVLDVFWKIYLGDVFIGVSLSTYSTLEAASTKAQVHQFHTFTGFSKLQPKLAACWSAICVKLFKTRITRVKCQLQLNRTLARFEEIGSFSTLHCTSCIKRQIWGQAGFFLHFIIAFSRCSSCDTAL